MNIFYLPINVLYPDTKSNRMIMREIKEPETMSFTDEKEANAMVQELTKCGLKVQKKKVKRRDNNVSMFFDEGKIYILDIYPPEIDIDTLSIMEVESYNSDLDPLELPESEENLNEILKYHREENVY